MTEGNIPYHVNIATRGVILYAKAKDKPRHNDWIILVTNVKEKTDAWGDRKPYLAVYRYISYDMDEKEFRFSDGEPCNWGRTISYDFFLASEEQRKFIIKELTKRGYKYIKCRNKLIKR